MQFRKLGFVVAIACCMRLTSAIATKKPPHLVYVLVDDMGFNDFYSSTDIAAAWPHVAQMAQSNCIEIEDFYTQHICTPSRASLMTGRMPLRLGLQHQVINGVENYGLPLDEVTLPDKLRAAGYKTYGVGKWHLGMYNNASTPIRRGFDHWFGFMNGYEDYWQHSVALGATPSTDPVENGYVDLTDDNRVVRDFNGTYGPEMFKDKVAAMISQHKSLAPTAPMFLYYAMQNVHEPLEPLSEDVNAEPCAGIANADRKKFCGLAKSADRALANLTASLDQAFDGEDYLVFISGDNGGLVSGAGNNCPNATSFCLRGEKATLYQGGVRNNGLMCSKTLVQPGKYAGGMVHLMDIHATFVELAAVAEPSILSMGKKLDGMSVWKAVTTGSPSPRTSLVHNIDPCSGHGKCNGVEAAIRSGDWKYLSGVSYDTWYPLPSSDNSGITSTSQGRVSSSSRALQQYQQTVWLFNVTADPGETTDVSADNADLVKSLQAQLDAVAKEALAPCNVPGGSCASEDMTGWAVIKAANAWVPWVKDNVTVEV